MFWETVEIGKSDYRSNQFSDKIDNRLTLDRFNQLVSRVLTHLLSIAQKTFQNGNRSNHLTLISCFDILQKFSNIKLSYTMSAFCRHPYW